MALTFLAIGQVKLGEEVSHNSTLFSQAHKIIEQIVCTYTTFELISGGYFVRGENSPSAFFTVDFVESHNRHLKIELITDFIFYLIRCERAGRGYVRSG